MRLQWQVIFKILIAVLAAGVFVYSLTWIFSGDAMLKDRLPSGTFVLYVGVLLFLWGYSDSRMFDKGVFALRTNLVRAVFVALTIVVGIATWLRVSSIDSEPFHRLAPVFWGLSLGYSLVIFVSIFGASFLGVIGNVLKLGRRD